MSDRREPPARSIAKFVRSTVLWRRLWFALASLATHGLFVGVALFLVDWAYPPIFSEAAWIGVGWLGLVLAWHAVNPGLSLQSADGVLGLQDRLMTWWTLRGRRADAATRWLEEDLSRSLADLPEGRRSRLWRRPMRRLLWVLPLLLVVWAIGPIGRAYILPSPYGVTEPRPKGPTAKQETGGGERKVAGRDTPDPETPDRRPKRDQKAPEQKDETRPDPPAPRPKGGELPPKPIQPLPAKDEFVIPKFVGEGDGEKKKTRVAVVEQGEGPTGTRPPGTTGGTGAESPEARDREFQRARERALRARHVPDRERGFVRRYFEELQRQGRRQP